MANIIIGIVAGVAVIMTCTAMVCATLALIKITKEFLEA